MGVLWSAQLCRCRAGVLAATQLFEELVATCGPVGVLGPDFFEERCNVVLSGVAGVPNVLPVVVAGFERVVLHRDQVEADIVESGFSGGHHRSSLLEIERSPLLMPISPGDTHPVR